VRALTGLVIAACVAAPGAVPAQSMLAIGGNAGTVVGVVLDSLRGGGLADADVVVEGMPALGSHTDSLGRFRIDSFPPGEHRLAVHHPILEVAGIRIFVGPISPNPRAATSVAISTPSARAVIAQLCVRYPDADVILFGLVRDSATNKPVDGALVTVAWQPEDGAVITREALSAPSGRFDLCIPSSSPAVLNIRLGGAASGKVPIPLKPNSAVLAEFHLSAKKSGKLDLALDPAR
jgi:hypothetical protein